MISDVPCESTTFQRWPFVSIVLAIRNEESRINQCLASLASMSYEGRYEVLVVDGMSTDSTPKLIEKFCLKHPKFRVLSNPKENVASGRNIGINNSRGTIVAFTDGDIVVHKDWLNKLVKNLVSGKSKIAGVGGPNITSPSANFVERCIRFSTSTFWGSGRSIQYAYSDKKKFVSSISGCNAAYWKYILIEMGGFDERFIGGSDPEFNLRLRKKGYVLEYVPEAKVIHFQDETLTSYMNRMISYGIARAMIMKKHPIESIPYILPTLMGLTSLFLLLLRLQYMPYILIAYMLISWVSSIPILRKVKSIPEFLLTPIFNLVEHITYFTGVLMGIFIDKSKKIKKVRMK